MTIKEVEKLLEIPRATVRFYEKEGLIAPTREGNGYRDYSDEDVEKLKKIIILRKIGMPVEEINDLFDGAQSMGEALDTNIANLQKQMEELKGALKLSQKMKEDAVEVSSMDVNTYWNTIEEEEKLGNSFIDIAKDIVEVEKGVIAGFFAWTDVNGKPYDSWPKMIVNVLLSLSLAGVVVCLMERTWSLPVFMRGVCGIGWIILVEVCISVPMYFLGRKFTWIQKNRKKALFFATVVLLFVLLILATVLDDSDQRTVTAVSRERFAECLEKTCGSKMRGSIKEVDDFQIEIVTEEGTESLIREQIGVNALLAEYDGGLVAYCFFDTKEAAESALLSGVSYHTKTKSFSCGEKDHKMSYTPGEPGFIVSKLSNRMDAYYYFDRVVIYVLTLDDNAVELANRMMDELGYPRVSLE